MQAYVYVAVLRDLTWNAEHTWVKTTVLRDALFAIGWSQHAWKKVRRMLVGALIIEEGKGHWVRVHPRIATGPTLHDSYRAVKLAEERARNLRNKSDAKVRLRHARDKGRSESPFGKPLFPAPIKKG